MSEVLLVSEGQPWMMAVATPVAGRLAGREQLPLLVAVGSPPGKPVATTLGGLGCRRCTFFSPAAAASVPAIGGLPPPEVIVVGTDPPGASLRVARRFWGTSRKVVAASKEDSAAMILGSSLAAHLAVPLLIYDPWADGADFARGLERLETKTVLVAAAATEQPPAWIRHLPAETTLLDPAALHRLLLERLGAAGIRTIVLARVPDEELGVGATAWLAPYIALARAAPVVLTDTDVAAEAERRLGQLQAAHRLTPRTVTILAEYHSIGTNLVRIQLEARDANGAKPEETHYEVPTEPCVPIDFSQTATVGVGRIPSDRLEEASVLFARGLVRAGRLAAQPPRMLMVANPALEDAFLPFCEAVSRLTAEELKNCGVQVEEVYRKPSNSPEARAAARTAHLIVYQGHLDQDYLFRDPPAPAQAKPSSPPSDDVEEMEESPGEQSGDFAPVAAVAANSAGVCRPCAEIPAKEQAPPRFEGPLEGLPIVVMQACHTLEDPAWQRMYELGGVAMLGTRTNVYSASASALVKAAVDGGLYRGACLGEALRDAQNYFFCLQELKQARGHQKMAEVRRVALSFCLWGDPELEMFPQGVGRPRRAPGSIAWEAPQSLLITLPAERLAEVRTDAYLARMFPGGETAGLTRRMHDQDVRQLVPLHFSRLPLPDGFTDLGYTVLRRAEDTSSRAVFRIDRQGRWLYVVYLPGREAPQEGFLLRFSKDGRQ